MTRDMLYLQCCPTDTRQREEVKSIWRILLFLFLSAIKNKKKPPVFALLRASFFLSTWTCYFFSPTGIIAYADQEINMQVILKHSETNKKLLFTHHGSLTVGYQKKVPAGRIKPAFFVSNFWFLSIVFYCNVL